MIFQSNKIFTINKLVSSLLSIFHGFSHIYQGTWNPSTEQIVICSWGGKRDTLSVRVQETRDSNGMQKQKHLFCRNYQHAVFMQCALNWRPLEEPVAPFMQGWRNFPERLSNISMISSGQISNIISIFSCYFVSFIIFGETSKRFRN